MGFLRSTLLATVLFVAVARPNPATAGPLTVFNFQVAGISAFSGGNNSLFVQGAWTPSLSLGFVGIRGEFGVTALQFGAGSRFIVTYYEALLQLTLLPTLTLEGGAGMHIWHGINPASLAITGNLAFSGVPAFSRVFVGYTRYTGGSGADEIRVGFGFNL